MRHLTVWMMIYKLSCATLKFKVLGWFDYENKVYELCLG